MGFFEILLIAVVALFVVGPERMPEAVRSVVLTMGRIKRSFNSARTELEKQIGTDDIRRQLHNESVMESLGKIKSELTSLEQKTEPLEAEAPWDEDEDEYDYGPDHHHNESDSAALDEYQEAKPAQNHAADDDNPPQQKTS